MPSPAAGAGWVGDEVVVVQPASPSIAPIASAETTARAREGCAGIGECYDLAAVLPDAKGRLPSVPWDGSTLCLRR